jgi:hypothetical protein
MPLPLIAAGLVVAGVSGTAGFLFTKKTLEDDKKNKQKQAEKLKNKKLSDVPLPKLGKGTYAQQTSTPLFKKGTFNSQKGKTDIFETSYNPDTNQVNTTIFSHQGPVVRFRYDTINPSYIEKSIETTQGTGPFRPLQYGSLSTPQIGEQLIERNPPNNTQPLGRREYAFRKGKGTVILERQGDVETTTIKTPTGEEAIYQKNLRTQQVKPIKRIKPKKPTKPIEPIKPLTPQEIEKLNQRLNKSTKNQGKKPIL